MCDGFEWELKWGMTTKQLYRQNIFQLLFCFCVATILYWKWQANKERRTTTTTTATNANENDGKKERMKRRKKNERERGREVENKKNTCRKQEFFSLSDWWCNGLWWLNCWMLHWKTHNSVSSCDASKYVTNCFCLIFN